MEILVLLHVVRALFDEWYFRKLKTEISVGSCPINCWRFPVRTSKEDLKMVSWFIGKNLASTCNLSYSERLLRLLRVLNSELYIHIIYLTTNGCSINGKPLGLIWAVDKTLDSGGLFVQISLELSINFYGAFWLSVMRLWVAAAALWLMYIRMHCETDFTQV